MFCKKIIFLLFGMMVLLQARAGDIQWCMTTNTGQVIPLSEVGYILNLGNNSETFNIVKVDGTVIEGIGKVTFSEQDLSGIKNMSLGSYGILTQQVDGSIVLTGISAGVPIFVYNIGGALVKQTVTSEELSEINVVDLVPGTYILRVGTTSIKFVKR